MSFYFFCSKRKEATDNASSNIYSSVSFPDTNSNMCCFTWWFMFLFFWGGYTLGIELSLAVTGLYRIDTWLHDCFPLSWWSSEKDIDTSMISQVIQIYGQTNIQNQNAWSYNLLWEIVTAELYPLCPFWLVNSSFSSRKWAWKNS